MDMIKFFKRRVEEIEKTINEKASKLYGADNEEKIEMLMEDDYGLFSTLELNRKLLDIHTKKILH